VVAVSLIMSCYRVDFGTKSGLLPLVPLTKSRGLMVKATCTIRISEARAENTPKRDFDRDPDPALLLCSPYWDISDFLDHDITVGQYSSSLKRIIHLKS
jgi:hypothetical protein